MYCPQAELRLRCSYNKSSSAPFGVDVLRSASGDERLRISFVAKNQSIVVDHARAWAGGVSVPSSRHPFPAGLNASEEVASARQTAPVPSNSQYPCVTCRSDGICAVNITVLVDHGLVETYAGGVALTSFASPSSGTSPDARVAAMFGVGGAGGTTCELHGRRLSLKTDDDSDRVRGKGTR